MHEYDETRWTVVVEGIEVQCRYCPIEYNESIIRVEIPLASRPGRYEPGDIHFDDDHEELYWRASGHPSNGEPRADDPNVAALTFLAEPDYAGKRFVRLRPEVCRAIRASLPVAPTPSRPPLVPALAELAAYCEAEGTPLGFPKRKPNRICVECLSPVYGEFCTHCHEG